MAPSASATAIPSSSSTTTANLDTKFAAVEASYGANVHVSTHPVLQHKISTLRSSATSQDIFRSTLKAITYHLGYEATSNLKTREVPISVSMGKNEETQADCMGIKLKDNVALIPILRSGLGMADGMMELLPKASVHHIGMYHLPGSEAPVQYFNRLPKKCTSDIAYVVDPVIASSATMMAVIAILKKWGVDKIHVLSVISSHHGLKTLSEAHPDVDFTVAHVDPVLTKDGLVLPGLGDAGDRLYGTQTQMMEEDEDEMLLHPSKRKRTMSNASEFQ
jgi:uracil phosphoribosyltransferase